MRIAVGMVLTGYCNGYFGRDSYCEKVVEAFGSDWVVARDSMKQIHFATFENQKEMDVLVEAWTQGKDS